MYFSLIALLLCLAKWASSQYCPDEYQRFTNQHTFCRKPNPTCQIKVRGLTAWDEINRILKIHNTLRNKVATGEETRAGRLPTATNMMQMVWDQELAAIAQKWAENCEFRHDCNECRGVESFSVGQNAAISSNHCSGRPCSNGEDKPDWEGIIQMFYDEVKDYDKRDVEKFGPSRNGKVIGHFTQVIWAQSWRVGCGFVAYQNGNSISKLYICNYGPAGNFGGASVYKPGPTCSNCPINSCCGNSCGGRSEYKGLCKMNNDNEAPQYQISKQGVIFYCDFASGNRDCELSTKGSGVQYRRTLDGTILSLRLREGEQTEVFFNKVFNPSSNFCLRIKFRQGPAKYGQANRSDMEMNVILDNYPVNMNLNYPYGSFIPYSISLWKAKDVKFSVKFSVPSGASEQILDIKDIIAYNGDCGSRKDK